MIYAYPNLPNWLDPSLIAENFDRKPDWIGEKKKNGWRCLAIREPETLTLWTRHKTIIGDPLPKTRAALLGLAPLTIIDGELIDKRTKDTKDEYYAFDIQVYQGRTLFGQPWRVRRALLEQATRDIEGITVSEPISTGKAMLYDLAIQSGDEGIVLKQVDSPYLLNTRECPHNPMWIKAKQPERCMRT